MWEFEKLNDEEINDFISRVVVQLEPKLTQQVLSVVEELLQYRKDIESGKIIRPKYPLYSIVYIIDYIDDKGYSIYGGKPTIRECFVCSISQIAINCPCLYRVQPKELPKDVLEGENENIEYWEKSWFEKDLYETKDEAEKKLKELKEKENEK